MRIFFTGASSFSGYWFAKTLAESGHTVVCPMTRGSASEYDGIRRLRVESLVSVPGILPLWSVRLSDESVDRVAAAAGSCEVFCHHAAEVGDYKSPAFDPLAGAAKSIEGVPGLIRRLAEAGCRHFVQTGTYFEADEGVDGEGAPAFSPYAVSKSLAGELTRFHAGKAGMAYTKFVMPNPFGPMEDRGFTWYLADEWLAGRTPAVKTPDYLRDNLPVTLMARAYVRAVEIVSPANFRRVTPSGFAGAQGDFARGFSQNLAAAGFPGGCPLSIATQLAFDEPRSRMNASAGHRLDWSPEEERDFWKQLAAYYTTALALV